jgi:hypothetical protein
MKKNLEYYPRESESYRHPKFKLLRTKFKNPTEGWAAEGRFWALNDQIAESENCQIDLSKERNKAVVAENLGMSLEQLKKFLELLLSPEIQLLKEIYPEVFTTDRVQETLEFTMSERENARKRKSSGGKKKSSDEKPESSPAPDNKLNETKLKEIKGKENTLPLEDQIMILWQKTFSRNPKTPEFDITKVHLEKFGFQKMFQAYKSAALDNIKKMKTLEEHIDKDGNYIPFEDKKTPIENSTYEPSPGYKYTPSPLCECGCGKPWTMRMREDEKSPFFKVASVECFQRCVSKNKNVFEKLAEEMNSALKI